MRIIWNSCFQNACVKPQPSHNKAEFREWGSVMCLWDAPDGSPIPLRTTDQHIIAFFKVGQMRLAEGIRREQLRSIHLAIR